MRVWGRHARRCAAGGGARTRSPSSYSEAQRAARPLLPLRYLPLRYLDTPGPSIAFGGCTPLVQRRSRRGWLLAATAVVWAVAEVRQSIKRRPEGVTAPKGSALYVRGFGAIGIVGAIVAAHDVPAAAIPPGIAWVALVLLWCGVGLRLWSFRTLGRYFTFTVQTSADQPVITDGPYRVVRHPSYAGILLAVIGVGLFIGNWVSFFILMVAFGCGIVFRIRVEERALLQELGEPYRAYAATHKRLVPFVW